VCKAARRRAGAPSKQRPASSNTLRSVAPLGGGQLVGHQRRTRGTRDRVSRGTGATSTSTPVARTASGACCPLEPPQGRIRLLPDLPATRRDPRTVPAHPHRAPLGPSKRASRTPRAASDSTNTRCAPGGRSAAGSPSPSSRPARTRSPTAISVQRDSRLAATGLARLYGELTRTRHDNSTTWAE
jgi:hypothetical protein